MDEKRFKEQLILDMVKEKRKIWKKGSGRNLLASLQEDFQKHSIKIGRDKFFDLLRDNGLLMKTRRRKAVTTFSYHRFHKYPNIIRELTPQKPGELMVSDITYVWISETESFAYLFLITDVYSRKIIGYCVSDTLKAASAIKALKKAIKQLPIPGQSIHHSDRGIQYCSYEYTNLLKKHGIKISMTENGDPLENAIAERINRTIKEEFTNEKTLTFKTFEEAKRSLPKIINFYNGKRPHRSIDMNTPNAAFKMEGELKKRWKNYNKNKNAQSAFEGEFSQACVQKYD
jgi:transposase InsO family protein